MAQPKVEPMGSATASAQEHVQVDSDFTAPITTSHTNPIANVAKPVESTIELLRCTVLATSSSDPTGYLHEAVRVSALVSCGFRHPCCKETWVGFRMDASHVQLLVEDVDKEASIQLFFRLPQWPQAPVALRHLKPKT